MDELNLTPQEKNHILALRAMEIIPHDLNLALSYLRTAIQNENPIPSVGVRMVAMECIEAAYRTCRYLCRASHGAPVRTGGLAPKVNHLFTLDDAGKVKMWNFQLKLSGEFEDPEGDLETVVFHPDGDSLLTAAGNGILRKVSLQGEVLHTFPRTMDSLLGAIWDPKGMHLLCADRSGKGWLLDKEGNPINSFQIGEASDSILSLDWHPEGNYWVFIAENGRVITGDRMGKILDQFHLDSWMIEGVVVSPQADKVLVWGEEGPAELAFLIADESGNRNPSRKLAGQWGGVTQAWFSPDGNTIYTAGEDDSLWYWEMIEEDPSGVFRFEGQGVSHLCCDPTGNRIATAHADGALQLWHQHGVPLYTLPPQPFPLAMVVGNPESGPLITADTQGTLLVWETRPGLYVEHYFPGMAQEGIANPLKMVTDPFQIIAASEEEGKIWIQQEDGERRMQEVLPGTPVESLAVNPEGTHLLAGGANGKVTLSELTTGKRIHQWKLKNSPFFLQFLAEDLGFAFDGMHTAWLLHLTTGKKNKLTSKTGIALAKAQFHAESGRLVTYGEEGTPVLWDRAGNCLNLLETPEANSLQEICFWEAANQWIGGDKKGVLHVYDHEGDRKGGWAAHQRGIRSLEVHPEGKWLLSASLDGTAVLWDSTGNRIKTYGKFDHLMWARWMPDGRELLVSGEYYPVLFSLDGTRLGRYPVFLYGNEDEIYPSPDGKRIWFVGVEESGIRIQGWPTVYGL